MKRKIKKLLLYLSSFLLMAFSLVEGQAVFQQVEKANSLLNQTNETFAKGHFKLPLAPTYQFNKKDALFDNQKEKVIKYDFLEKEHKKISIINFLNTEREFRFLDKMA